MPDDERDRRQVPVRLMDLCRDTLKRCLASRIALERKLLDANARIQRLTKDKDRLERAVTRLRRRRPPPD